MTFGDLFVMVSVMVGGGGAVEDWWGRFGFFIYLFIYFRKLKLENA